MRILILTQVFYPDTVSVSQHLTDLSKHLVNEGHHVEVITSCFPYEEKNTRFSKQEDFEGVKINRVSQSKFGKGSIIIRILDYFTFNFSIGSKYLFKKKDFEVVFVSTSPPFLSFITTLLSLIKRVPVYFWVMDLQPELSIASGLIKKNSLTARFFTFIGNFTIRNSTRLFSLDRFMTNYLISRGAKNENIITTPVWPVIDGIYEGDRLENPFRKDNKFSDKLVIMYSGNHSYVHPLDTILEAANKLKGDDRFLFVFVGGGVRRKDVTEFKTNNKLYNIQQLPFQPRDQIKYSLASADIHLVILGEGQVGYTHPNKIYGALFIGKPILYIGPNESHVSDITNGIPGNISVNHGQVEQLVFALKDFASLTEAQREDIGKNNQEYANLNLVPKVLMKNISNHFTP